MISEWCDRREAEIAAARAAGFTGRPPIDIGDDEDDDLDLDIAPPIRITG